MRKNVLPSFVALGILCFVALIYWPVHQAGFVWVDKIGFYDNAWLRYGDDWKHYIFHNFYDWTDYFRPLVVALFVLQLRVFDVAPGPMHLVSLGIHLATTLTVGLLALRLFPKPRSSLQTAIIVGAPMLLYGLHPALVEPVVWISCQYELIVTFFMVLGLLLNASIERRAARAVAVASCFFFAACSHEAAVSFPLLLVLIDWMQTKSPADQARGSTIFALRSLWQRQWFTYVCVLAAGIFYLAFRYWGLGFLLHPKSTPPDFTLSHLQTVTFVYLTYWRILLWPMIELGPLHVVDMHRFVALSASSGAIDFTAAILLFFGIYYAWKRKPIGCLIITVTACLLPVLHIIPIRDASLYHERYVLAPVAMACALLPCALSTLALSRSQMRALAMVIFIVAFGWLALATVNVRATVPLWSDEAKLWQWMLREHPESVEAKDHLLSTYIELNDRVHAHQIIDLLMADKTVCPMCMLNVANLALSEGNSKLATIALEKVKDTSHAESQPRLVQGFILATGQLRELNGDSTGAAEAYRDAIAMEPMDPQAQMNLALLLARQGKAVDARKQADLALSLLAPDQRDGKRKFFEQTLNAAVNQRNEASP